MEEPKQTLANKLAKAMSSIGAVSKDGNNNFQRYSFQSEAAIKAAVKKAITDVGIVIVPEYKVINQADRLSEKGKNNHFVDVMGTFTITDGVEKIVGSMPGSGQDTADKAVQKACTSAQKYFYKQLFNITDQDDDPDSEDSEPMRPAKPAYALASIKQISTINEGFKQMNTMRANSGDAAKKYFLGNYKINEVSKLSTNQAESLIKTISEKVSEYGKASSQPKEFDNAFV